MEAKSGGMRKTKAKKKNQTKDKRVQSMGPEWNAETHQRQKKEDRFDENFRCVRWPPMARPVGFVSVFLFYRDSFVLLFSSSVGLLLSDGFGRGQRVLLLRFGVFQFGRIERFDALAQLLLALLLGDHCR